MYAVIQKKWLIPIALLTAALTLACSLATQFFSRPLQIPNTAAPVGLIAYSGTDGNIYTIDWEGKQPTAITNDANLSPDAGMVARLYQYPTWAPNGRRLAFVGFSGSLPTDTEASLYTSASDGKKLVIAFSSQRIIPFYLFWSPNSQSVSFLSSNYDGNGLVLQLANAEGNAASEDIQVIGSGQPFYWDWSPDNKLIFAHTGGATTDNPAAQIVIYELGASVQKKELALKPSSFQAPAWSPDGKELILAAENEAGEGELVLVGREGDIKRTLAQVQGPLAFAWSPNGDRIAYATADEVIPAGLFTRLIMLDPARPDEAKDVDQSALAAFFWSPDSRKIAYFVPKVEPPDETSSNNSQSSATLFLQLQVYDLASGQSKQVAVFQPTNAFLQIIPFFDQYQRSGTIWSPDSKNLVLSAIDSTGDSQIMVVAADGSQSHPIADGNLAFWSWK